MCVVWLLVPPLTPVFCVVLGPIFALSEMLRVGHFFASASLFSMVNTAVIMSIRLVRQGSDSWFYNLMELVTICVLKLCAWWCTNAQIMYLEVSRDMSFTRASEADIVGNMIANTSTSIYSTEADAESVRQFSKHSIQGRAAHPASEPSSANGSPILPPMLSSSLDPRPQPSPF